MAMHRLAHFSADRSPMTPTDRIASAAQRLAHDSAAVDTLEASFTKLLKEPHRERFRKVNLRSPAMQRVAAVGGAMEILHATGWEHAPHGHLLLNTLEPRLIEAATAALQKVQASHPGYLRDREGRRAGAARARESAEAAAADLARRQHFASMLPAEPAEGAAGAAAICVHLGGEKKVWRRFDSNIDTLKDLVHWVSSLEGAPASPRLVNVTQSPSLPLDKERQAGLSLHHLDLWPCGHVKLVECA